MTNVEAAFSAILFVLTFGSAYVILQQLNCIMYLKSVRKINEAYIAQLEKSFRDMSDSAMAAHDRHKETLQKFGLLPPKIVRNRKDVN